MEERRIDIENKRKKLKKKLHPGLEQLEKDYTKMLAAEGNQDDDDELYFSEPKHLLDIFTWLEEQNLFLIQNTQETEEAMEEVEWRFWETRVVMEAKTSWLKDNIQLLDMQIHEKKWLCE